MDKTRVCIPSVGLVNGGVALPSVVVGHRTSDYVVRRISRPMRSGVRVIGSGEPIDWNEVYR